MGLMNGAKIQDGTSNPGNACLDSEGATVVCLMPMIISGFMAIWVLCITACALLAYLLPSCQVDEGS